MKTVLSVIIPCYNGERFVMQAIKSVLNQPIKNLIVIVVDDGSTDRSYSLLKQIEQNDDRIYVVHQENMGVSAARNLGIKISVSKGASYIAFLDSDDVWCDNVYGEEIFRILGSNQFDLF